MGQKAWGAKTTPHRKRIVKTAEMTVLRRLSESGQLVAENSATNLFNGNLAAENSALRMNNLVAEKSATNYLTEIWQLKIQQPNICRGVKAENWALIGKEKHHGRGKDL